MSASSSAKRAGAVRSCASWTTRSLRPRPSVASVFFGGGTPSLMSGRAVGLVLDGIAKRWTVDDDVEITLEANPNSVEQGRFRDYRAAGVNRVSIGVQSLDASALKALGRLHTADEALAALDLAKRHFGRVSFDLIYAREGADGAGLARRVGLALRHAADHLSLYQLTIEPGTPFAARHEAGTLKHAERSGGARAISPHAGTLRGGGTSPLTKSRTMRGRDRSRGDNLLYWRAHDYAGIGPGAHSRISLDGAKRALATIKSPEDWRASVEACGHGVASDDALSAEEAAEEYLLMGMRLSEGIDLARFAAIGGRVLDEARIASLARRRSRCAQRQAARRHAKRAARARPADRRACGLGSNKTRRWRRRAARGRSRRGRLPALRGWRGRARTCRRRAAGTGRRRRRSRSAA